MGFALIGGSGKKHALQDSVTFAHVAERARRAGDLHRAVALCRDGLKRFPGHVSARVTLGLALLDLAQYAQARAELQQALKRAPDNLAAIRGLAQLHDHPDDSSHLDDVEDSQPQSHWRPLTPAYEAAEEAEAPAAPSSVQPAVSVRPRERAGDRASVAPAFPAPALAPEVPSRPVQIEPTRGTAPAFHMTPEPAAEMPISLDLVSEPAAADALVRSWEFDADLAAYNAALPIKMSLPPVHDESPAIEDDEQVPDAAPSTAALPAAPVAAAFERLLSQVTRQRRLMSA